MNDEAHGNSPKLTIEVASTVLVMTCGAIVGLVLPGKSEAIVTNAVVAALVAWLFWIRRRDSVARTLTVAVGMVIVLWPITFVLLDWLHRYY